MKFSLLSIILSFTTFTSFIGSYFLEITLNNFEQFLSVFCVVILDGIFGCIKGIKESGFKTCRSLSIIRTLGIWWLILGAILTIEKAFPGTSWLSETVLAPFLILQVISAIKNASLCGYIRNEVLLSILDKIDKHKGERTK